MNNTFRLILGSPGNNRIFYTKQDEDRFLDYARIYKDRFSIKVLAFSLKENSANFLIYDSENKRDSFAKYLSEAYHYYLNLMEREVGCRITAKLFKIESKKDFLELMRFLHCSGRHSLKSYQEYTRYVNNDLLDISLVLNSFDVTGKNKKQLFLDELVKEPSSSYVLQFEKQEIFKRDKLIKRRERAQKFFNAYVTELGLTAEEFLEGTYDDEKKRLISRFRDETDLSFRDIGYVLGLSHTTVIRMHGESNGHD